MHQKKHDPSLSGWLKVVVGIAVATAATAGVGSSSAPNPQPPTACVQMRAL